MIVLMNSQKKKDLIIFEKYTTPSEKPEYKRKNIFLLFTA